ncbi:DNA cytosine methyltransferase [Hymenobacter sp. M29]|uniref:DNA (cytosine-5-)-methyltransferase n=1 Tax=Hymenobacter mellowenesis TaxID=3063995 RepID=A0ABT9AJ84_9BACT|nr:DNA cytosine methyltransferase [Hymenobacter sp. M29]MDO7849925.1 DNA cytosine methyltransferase [Hymenobacter sp. M29]
MRLLSLFAGIGGFDLAAHWMGWATAVMVEIDPFARQVLIKNFKCIPAEDLGAAELADIISQWKVWRPGQLQPQTVLYGDICQFDARLWLGAIDLVCGGFPCQPFSDAGKGLGTNDPRHLWPQMLRVIREVRPCHVLGENVRGLLTRHPLQFEAVCAELEAEGYDVQPVLLPACGVGAIHKRDRFWFVAHSLRWQSERRREPRIIHGASRQTEGEAQQWERSQHAPGSIREDAPDAHGSRWGAEQSGLRRGQPNAFGGTASDPIGERWKEQPAICLAHEAKRGGASDCNSENDAGHPPRIERNGEALTPVILSGQRQNGAAVSKSVGEWRFTEPALCARNDGLPGRLVRTDRAKILKAAGNAVVPQVVLQFYKAIDGTRRLLYPEHFGNG